MMMHAYSEMYLNRAQSVLGDAFDYAVNICNIPGQDFAGLFALSSACKRMENGEPLYLAGKSGIEITEEIVEETRGIEIRIKPVERFIRTREYWIGWAIAYYQWYSGRRYGDVFKAISYEKLEKMYDTLHEADVRKFADIVDLRIKDHFQETNLKRIRRISALTQAELAERSGVSLRSIQMYEQRNKNINKASVDAVVQLAKTLGCEIKELLESNAAINDGKAEGR